MIEIIIFIYLEKLKKLPYKTLNEICLNNELKIMSYLSSKNKLQRMRTTIICIIIIRASNDHCQCCYKIHLFYGIMLLCENL